MPTLRPPLHSRKSLLYRRLSPSTIFLCTIVLEEFGVLLILVRCDMFFQDSTCLYRGLRFSMRFTQMARGEKHWCIVRFSISKESFLIFKAGIFKVKIVHNYGPYSIPGFSRLANNREPKV